MLERSSQAAIMPYLDGLTMRGRAGPGRARAVPAHHAVRTVCGLEPFLAVLIVTGLRLVHLDSFTSVFTISA